MSQTQLLTRDAYGVTYADPLDRDFTVRFKTVNNRKNLNGIAVDNFLTEIIVNDLNDIDVSGQPARDALSVRVKVSGSDLSKGRLGAILSSIATQLPAWESENVLLGFSPVTVPVNPPSE